MYVRVECLSNGGNCCQSLTSHYLVHLPQEHTQRLLQSLLIHGILVGQRSLYVVNHTEYFLKQSFLLSLSTICRYTLLPLAEVFHLGTLTQVLIPVFKGLLPR